MRYYFTYSEEETIRNDQETRDTMEKCEQDGRPRDGIKGKSVLANLENFKLNESALIDVMHCVFLGVIRNLISIWLDTSNSSEEFYIGNKIGQINNLLVGLKFPKNHTRFPSNISEFHKWKAHEIRTFLLIYCYFVLKDFLAVKFLEHLCLLSEAISIFYQNEIDEENFLLASSLLKRFLIDFPIFYGEKRMTFNVHLLKHLPQMVLNAGPLWCYSLFPFESKNGFISTLVSGKRNCPQELAIKLMILQNVPEVVHSNKHKLCGNVYLPNNSKKINSIPFKDMIPQNLQNVPAFEFKYFIKDSIFYNSANINYSGRHSDSYVELNDRSLVKILKIISLNHEIFLFVEKKYQIEKRIAQFKTLIDCTVVKYLIRVEDVNRKVYLFENVKGCVQHDKLFEGD